MTADESEMMLAGAFRLGGVVARIRYEECGTTNAYTVFFGDPEDEAFAVVQDTQLADLADAAKAALHVIRQFDDEYSLVKLAETLRGYAIERLDNDPTPSTKEDTP